MAGPSGFSLKASPALTWVMLFFYGVPGPYPAVPELKCYIPQGVAPSGKFIMPSWSPDGTELAVTESDGIHIFGIVDRWIV